VINLIYEFDEKKPVIDKKSYVSKEAVIIGDVELSEDSSIFFGAVLRGDIETITIGFGSNVQDNATIHTDYGKSCNIGKYVSVGHNVVLHGCVVEDNVIIGMGSVVLDGAIIPQNCIIGAGSIVTSKSKLEPGTLILGSPAKSVRNLTTEEIEKIKGNSLDYIKKSKIYKLNLKEVENER
jgi:carbonic anhydrase/acetyltransferase-like protein (isoleucine patch superfamily)